MLLFLVEVHRLRQREAAIALPPGLGVVASILICRFGVRAAVALIPVSAFACVRAEIMHGFGCWFDVGFAGKSCFTRLSTGPAVRNAVVCVENGRAD